MRSQKWERHHDCCHVPSNQIATMSACRSRPRRAPATILSAFDRKTHQAVLRPTSDVGWHLIRVCVTFRARFSFVGCFGIIWGMAKTTKLAFGPGIIVRGVAFRGNRWVVSAEGKGSRSCPGCGEASGSRHSWQMRRLQELPIQGVPATLEIRSGRWRCRNEQCARKTFAEAWRSRYPPRGKHSELANSFGYSPMPPAAGSANGC